jgi:hypothetical protein
VRTLVILIIPLVACGRSGFDELSPPVDSAPDAALPPVLACDAVPRFSVIPKTAQLSATATSDGYAVLNVDDMGDVRGFSYRFSPGDPAHATLTEAIVQLPVAPNATGPVGSYAFGDQLLVELPYGRPQATGTSLIPLDAQLAPIGAPVQHAGWYGAAGTVTRNVAGTSAFLGQRLSDGEVDAVLVSPLGVAATPQVPLLGAAAGANNPTIVAAGTRFLLVWNAPGSPNEVRAQIFDDQLVPRTPPTRISADPTFGSITPRAAYAAGADRYLFAWSEKVNGGMDEIWLSLRDGNLVEVVPPLKITSQGVRPAIAAGDDHFLVVWQDGGAGYRLGAARVDKDGAHMALGIAGTGGTTAGWDLVVRYGQPALVWIEAGGIGPNLWLDPLCR